MNYGSVCSGIEAAGVAWAPLGWRPAFLSEIEKFPRAVLAHRLGAGTANGPPLHGDFTTIGADDYGPIDLLVGGTPCQSFSIAGLRGGLDDDRGNLALEFLRLADRKRPDWIIWENVPGVLSLDGGRGFGSILGALVELGYGFAYRVLDAQYVRVDGFGRAVPQRRRRVFVIGYLGDWRYPAAVLFERESLSGHSAPRRKAGQDVAGTLEASIDRRRGSGMNPSQLVGDVAPTISARPSGGGGLGTDFDCDGGLIPRVYGGGARGEREVAATLAATLAAHGRRQDFDVENFVAHTLRGEGFDASEDGSGRGTPLVPVAFDTTQITSPANRSNPKPGDPCHPLAAGAHAPAIAFAFSCKDHGADYGEISPTLRAMGHAGSHPNAGGQVAVAYDLRGRDGGAMMEGPHDTANIRASDGGSSRSYVADQYAVRRLTPRECERLMGFPDDYTMIPWRGKSAADCPDGPRYKALGNSMAVNVMRWIGARINILNEMMARAGVSQ